MKLQNIDVNGTLEKARQAIADASVSPEIRTLVSLLIMIIDMMLQKFGADSRNSSKPPSQDPNRAKSKRTKGQRKPGGQNGHAGSTLAQVSDPDEIVNIVVDLKKLPQTGSLKEAEPIRRQVFDIKMSIYVTEYRAAVLVDENGNRYVAQFPKGVDAPVQYGAGIRGQIAYMSGFQFIPAERICDYFRHNYGLPMSAGTVVNVFSEAGKNLGTFAKAAQSALTKTPVLHHDETGVNVGGKNTWLHSASNEKWTLFSVHQKRGCEGLDSAGILSAFSGVLVHDHWKPYFKYSCEHALCNAHHLRELTRASEDDSQKWAKEMLDFLISVNEEVNATSCGCLSEERAVEREKEFDGIIERGEVECPLPNAPPAGKKTRGRQKRSRPRNLLDRLRDRKRETLRFMRDPLVPFTNNQGERDIRMTKVQQKVSGCFRSLEGAQAFCLLRSFISSCIKQGVSVSEALADLFRGKLPDFVTQSADTT